MGNFWNYQDDEPEWGLPDLTSGLDSVFTPTTSKPMDWEQAFGKPTYGNEQLKASEEEAKARQSAFGYLQKTINTNSDIAPSQGIAAAILAAIPTLGGYMLGKSAPKIPDNVFFRNSSDLEAFTDPRAKALAQGAELGQQVGSGYLADIEKVAADNRTTNKELGLLEERKAERLAQEAKDYKMAGLNADKQMQIQEDSQQFQRESIGIQKAAEIEAHRQKRKIDLENPDGDNALVDPLKRTYLAKELGLTPEQAAMIKTEGDVKQFITLNRDIDVQARADRRRADAIQKTQIAGLNKIKEVIPEDDYKKAVELYGNYKELNEVYLPELKRVWTDPRASINDKEGALAATVIAIKTHKAMGANFTELEKNLIDAGLPTLATISPSQLTKYIRDQAQGQNAIGKIDNLARMTRLATESRLPTYGFEFPGETSSFGGNQDDAGGGSLPAVGGTFQGKKVLKVTKVK